MLASWLHPVKGQPASLPFVVPGLEGAGTERSPVSPRLGPGTPWPWDSGSSPPPLPRELALCEGLGAVNILRRPCPWGQKLWEWGGRRSRQLPRPPRLPAARCPPPPGAPASLRGGSPHVHSPIWFLSRWSLWRLASHTVVSGRCRTRPDAPDSHRVWGLPAAPSGRLPGLLEAELKSLIGRPAQRSV